jgi:hypothetical protein
MSGRRRAALVGWGVVAVVVPAFLALVEVLWLPLRVGPVPLPVSVVAAVVGNPLLVVLAHRLSRSTLVAVLPAVVWLLVVVRASVPRPEGDLLLIGSGTLGVLTLVFLGLGLVSAAAAVGRVLGAAARDRRRAVPGPAEVRVPTGSGSGGAR